MSQYPEEYLLQNLEFSLFPDKFSDIPQVESANTSDTYQNLMLEEGIYSQGVSMAPMGYSTPSHMENFDGQASLLTDLENMNLRSPNSAYLSPDWEDIVNSILTDNDSAFDMGNATGMQHLDLDTAAATWPDTDLVDDVLGYPGMTIDSAPICVSTAPTVTPMGATAMQPTATRPRRKTRKSKKPTIMNEEVPGPSNFEESYPNLDQFGVQSPTSPSSYYSDTGSSINDEVPQRPRQRRPRVSYSTLTDEERYRRIRELNNEASKIYREKKKVSQAQAAKQLPSLEARNSKLKLTFEQMQKLRDQMEKVANAYLGQRAPQSQSFYR